MIHGTPEITRKRESCSGLGRLLQKAYLEGRQIWIWTDGNAQFWIFYLFDVWSKLDQRQTRSSELEFNVVHKPSVKHQSAGKRARLSSDGHNTAWLEDAFLILSIVKVEEETSAMEDVENGHFLDEVLEMTAPGLPALFEKTMHQPGFPGSRKPCSRWIIHVLILSMGTVGS